jgi:transmembrane sensor
VYLRATVRDITLERGEALFDVAPEPQRPFRVSAGDVVFESHGSRFNLRRKDTQEIELVVIQGTLEVIGAMLATNSGPRKETRSYTVLQGQAMKVSAGRLLPGSPFQTLRNGEVAWTSGIIGVNGTLEEVVSEFNRYNTRKLLIADPALRTRRVAGWLKAKDPDTFAIDLLETHGIEHRLVTVDGREEILLGGMRNRRDAKHLGENP